MHSGVYHLISVFFYNHVSESTYTAQTSPVEERHDPYLNMNVHLKLNLKSDKSLKSRSKPEATRDGYITYV